MRSPLTAANGKRLKSKETNSWQSAVGSLKLAVCSNKCSVISIR